MSDKMIPCLMPTSPPPPATPRLVPAHSLDLINRQRMWSGVLFLVGCQLVLVCWSLKRLLKRGRKREEILREVGKEGGRKTVINRADNIRVSKQLETGNSELHSQPSFVNK